VDEKVVLSLASVVVGWVLAQATTTVREWWTAKRLKRGLLEELEDIGSQLPRAAMIYARHLQVFALRGCDPSMPLPINNLFFKQYYKDVFHRLSREQRLSYQLIHSSLDGLNKQFEDLAGAASTCANLRGPRDQALLNGAINAWGDVVTATFQNIRDVQWHIAHHLTNRHGPDLTLYGSIHAEHLRFKEEMRKEATAILDDGLRLNREDFEKIYDEAAFKKLSIKT